MPPSVGAEAEPRPPLKLAVVAPRPAPTLPSAKSPARRICRGVAEIAIGREASPCLVAAVEQIEADRAGYDRYHRFAYPQAAALFGEPGLHAAAGIQSERRAAGKRDCVDRLRRCLRARAARSSRVPGPPPRTSIEATAGESKMIAVTPEASAASSAWPTRTPAISVSRFFKASQALFRRPASASGRFTSRIYQPHGMLQLPSARRIIRASSDLR